MACLPIHPRKLAKKLGQGFLFTKFESTQMLRCRLNIAGTVLTKYQQENRLDPYSTPLKTCFFLSLAAHFVRPRLAGMLGGEGFTISTGFYTAEEILRRFERQGGW